MKAKQRDAKVTSENLPSRGKLPRKSGLRNETRGKAAGSRKRKPRRSIVDFARGR